MLAGRTAVESQVIAGPDHGCGESPFQAFHCVPCMSLRLLNDIAAMLAPPIVAMQHLTGRSYYKPSTVLRTD